jgi:uncharacterized protein YcnI
VIFSTIQETFIMKKFIRIHRIIATLLAIISTPLFAHVVLEEKSAPAGSSYKAVLRVSHGCEGSATTGITVQIPAGFKGAKPMPKAGWVLSIKSAKLRAPYVNHGKQITEDVTEVSWVADSHEFWLLDAHYDEFILRGTLPDSVGTLWFKVLQTCEKGQNHWTEIPTSGTSTTGLKAPAALLEVIPVKSHEHQH